MNALRIFRCPGGKLRGALLALGCVILLLSSAHAQTMDDGNRAFADGRFQESTAAFQALITQNGYSAPVLFDLGNSYVRQNKLAEAILAYKRAQWLAPRDEDITANLALAEKQAGLPATEARLPERIAAILTANSWAWIGSASLFLLCASIFAATRLPKWRALFQVAAAAAVVYLLAAIGALALGSARLHEAVFMDRNASALISPFPGAQSAFSPLPGQTLAVGKSYGNYFLVRDSAGHKGWIGKSQIAMLIPSSTAQGMF